MSSRTLRRLYVDLSLDRGTILTNIDNHHKTAEQVIVTKTSTMTETSEQEDYATIKLISTIPCLKRVDFVEFGRNDPLSVRGLATLLQRSVHLETLFLGAVHINGSPNDYTNLIEQFRSHPALRKIYWNACLTYPKQTRVIQEMAEALSKLPTLREVEIIETRYLPAGTWTGDALAAFGRSPCIKKLSIIGAHNLCSNGIVVKLAAALETNNSLEELRLVYDLDSADVGAICRMLCVNTSLQSLFLNRIPNCTEAISIMESMMNNTCVRELNLYFREEHLVESVRSAFLRLLQQNFTLEKVGGGWACQDMEFFLRLNHSGRKRIMGGTTDSRKDDWIDIMAKRQDCVPSLYYLLALYPPLCIEAL